MVLKKLENGSYLFSLDSINVMTKTTLQIIDMEKDVFETVT